jgi:hypothetical protein
LSKRDALSLLLVLVFYQVQEKARTRRTFFRHFKILCVLSQEAVSIESEAAGAGPRSSEHSVSPQIIEGEPMWVSVII